VDGFGVDEALFARLGLAGFGDQLVDALLIKGFVVDPGSANRDTRHGKEREDGQRNPCEHE
jgi:hypothetical protein